jgi:hypothetical protein
VFGVLLALFATGGFVPRYSMPTVVGVSIGVPLAIARLARRARVAEIALVLLLAVMFLESIPPLSPVRRFDDPVTARPLLADALRIPGPTVVTGELMFLQLWYYAPADAKMQLRYLADPALALHYRGSDIVDLNYLALARWTGVPVEAFDAFTETHGTFRVYAAGSGWLLDRLRDERASITRLGSEPGGTLYGATLSRR